MSLILNIIKRGYMYKFLMEIQCSDFFDSSSNQDEYLLSVVLAASLLAGTSLWMAMTINGNQKEEILMKNNKIENLQQLLGLLTKNCFLYTEINKVEEAFNYYLKQQVDSNILEQDQTQLINFNLILHNLYDQCYQLDDTSVDLRVKTSFLETQLVDLIESQTEILKGLLDENFDLKSAGIDIKNQQEINILKKDTELQELRMQLSLIKTKTGFFDGNNISEVEEPKNNLAEFRPLK